jgi:hypothetical protein
MPEAGTAGSHVNAIQFSGVPGQKKSAKSSPELIDRRKSS